jgi:predicted CDP-diglyceride synthetase/phosphatidate cytidylyltransferase
MYIYYSLWSIILFTNIDVSRYILVVDTSVLVKSNMGWREYNIHAQIKTTGKMSESIVWFRHEINLKYETLGLAFWSVNRIFSNSSWLVSLSSSSRDILNTRE